jgi:hypothetical protein
VTENFLLSGLFCDEWNPEGDKPKGGTKGGTKGGVINDTGYGS